MRTTYIAKEADIVKKWYVIDAEGVTLGRLASEVASILRGKNKPQYAPNVDMGDYVIIVNAEKVAVVPGNAFGASGEGFIRCSYASSMENIKEALKRIEAFINRHKK